MENNENVQKTPEQQDCQASDAVPQAQADQLKKGIADHKDRPVLIGIAAAAVLLVLVILIPAMVKGAEQGKVKKAFKTYVDVFKTGEKDAGDVKWKKYYPKNVAGDYQDWAEDMYDYYDESDYFDDFEYKVLSITKLSKKDSEEIYEDQIEYFFEERDCRIRKKNLKISHVYLLCIRNDTERHPEIGFAVVAKVNGKCGVYCSDF